MLQLVIANHRVTHSNGENSRDFEFTTTQEEMNADTGYVGLKNLGAVSMMMLDDDDARGACWCMLYHLHLHIVP